MPAKKNTDRTRTGARKNAEPMKQPRAAKGRTSASSARAGTAPQRPNDPEQTPIGTPERKPKRAAAALSKTGKKPARNRAAQPAAKRSDSSKGARSRGRGSQKSAGEKSAAKSR